MKISYTYSAHVTVLFYSEKEGLTLRCNDCGTLDDVRERTQEIMLNHFFNAADVCDANTGEVLMQMSWDY